MQFLNLFTKLFSDHPSNWQRIVSFRQRYLNCRLITPLLLVVIPVAAQPGTRNQQSPSTVTPVVQQKSKPLPTKSVEVEIGGEEIHNYEVKLRTGEFLHAIVDQRGNSVVVTLYSPTGEKLLTADIFGLLGPEPISHEAQETGLYRLEVRPSSPELVRGRYQISSSVKSSATAEDRKRMQAEKLVIEADVLQRSNSPESWQQSIEKYGQAASLWRELADQYWEAHAMNAQGNSYLRLDQKEKALELYESAVTLRKSIQDHKGVAASLINVGRVYARRGETQKALDLFSQAADFLKQSKSAAYEAYQLDEIALVCLQELKAFRKTLEFADQALSIERSLNDKSGETLTLLIVGRAYNEMGEKQKGLAILLDVLERHKAGYQRANQVSTLIKVALIYDELSEPQKAIEYFDQVVPLQKAAGNQYGAALTLHQLGVLHASIGNRSKALECFNLSLPQLRASGDVESLLSLAENYVSLSEFSKALEASNHALAMSRCGSNRKYEAFALLMIGIIRSQQGELREAQAVLEQSLSLFRTLKEAPGQDTSLSGQATSLLGLGLVYAGFGQTQKAFDTLQTALGLFKSIGDNKQQATTLQTLGFLHSIIGDKQKAEEYIRQASALKKDHGEFRVGAVSAMLVGAVSLNNEDPQKALNSLTQALQVFRAARDPNNEAYILDAIGILYNVLGEHKKALETYNQSLKLFRTVGNHRGEAASLSSIGFTFSKLKNFKEAQDYLNQALVLAKAQGDKYSEADALGSIGYVYDQLSQFKSALDYYNQALPIYHEIGMRKSEAYTLTKKGDTYRKIGDLRNALPLQIQALGIFREADSLMGEGAVFANLMELWRDLGNQRLAILYGKQAVNAFQETRRGIKELDKSLQSSYRKSKEETYRKLANLLISEGRLPEAREVLDLLKEEEFFQFIRRDPTALALLKRADLTPEETAAVKRYNENAEVISKLAQEFDNLRKQGTSADDPRYQKLQQDLEAANRTFQVGSQAIGR